MYLQVELESQKATDANLERIITDYCEMKQANDQLENEMSMKRV